MNAVTTKRKFGYWAFASGSALSFLFWILASSSAVSAATTVNNRHDIHFQQYTEKFFGRDYDWRLFKSQGFVESRLRQKARSQRGAEGVMQIMPATYREIQKKHNYFKEKPSDSAKINIAAGIFYDYYLFSRWEEKNISVEQRMKLMLASYNGGFSRTLKAWLKAGKPVYDWDAIAKLLPSETRNYVDRVIKHYQNQTAATLIAQTENGCPIAATFERSFC